MKKTLLIAATIYISLLFKMSLLAQSDSSRLECGSIIQGEFTKDHQVLNYNIDLAPGDSFTVRGTAVGDFLQFDIVILSPSDTHVGYAGSDAFFGNSEWYKEPVATTGILGERGNYRIYITNRDAFGIYTLYLGCTLADGTVVEPGDTLTDSTPPDTSFSGNGFPGIPSKDFSDGVIISLSIGTPNGGNITTNFTSVFGYTFDAQANDVFALDFTRTSGNLNLGLAVLSPNNKIVFEVSLVTSSDLSTHFTLPSSGTYTIGVYKIDLLPPDSPQNTAFQITGTLNP